MSTICYSLSSSNRRRFATDFPQSCCCVTCETLAFRRGQKRGCDSQLTSYSWWKWEVQSETVIQSAGPALPRVEYLASAQPLWLEPESWLTQIPEILKSELIHQLCAEWTHQFLPCLPWMQTINSFHIAKREIMYNKHFSLTEAKLNIWIHSFIHTI